MAHQTDHKQLSSSLKKTLASNVSGAFPHSSKNALNARKKTPVLTREQFSADLQALFEAALLAGNYIAALRAKELIGKTQGFLVAPSKATPGKEFKPESMSAAELEEMIEKLEDVCESKPLPGEQLVGVCEGK